ncbi:hypothetical protein MKW92_022728 [Papaver armeniacum]|nr:hypothetical protein MKW92_022728 [Papaver armeniacum]
MFFISLAVSAPLLLLLLLLHNFLSRKNKTNSRRLPPVPPGWPLIGNLLDLCYNLKAPHKTLVEIQKKYGLIFFLRVGATKAIVIASADAAMELFKSRDQAFINRHPIQVLKPSIDDNATPFSPYGPIWRMNRRLYATFFSRTTLNNTVGKRRQFVDQIKQWISVAEKEGKSVEIKHLTFVVVVSFANLWGNLFFSKDIMDLKPGNELYQRLGEIGVAITSPIAADFYPMLQNLDPQNLINRLKKAGRACINIVDGFAKERRSADVLRNNNQEKDCWDLLMDFQGIGKDEPRKLSRGQINWFITILHILVGSLLQSFDWTLENGVTPESIDMDEKQDLAVKKSTPLRIIPRASALAV